MIKGVLVVVAILSVLYVTICVLAYAFQERLIFFPNRLDSQYRFSFTEPFKEIFIDTDDGNKLHGLLFTAVQSRGVILYLHGNAGALDGWGDVASTYLQLHYDVLLLDYRGYGKSGGAIESEKQLAQDVQRAYDYLLGKYQERDIVVLGYSLGSGLAAKVASVNRPRLLIMQAPYYSLTDMMRHSFPFLPTFLLKYKLSTHDVITACQMPVVLFHGDQDEVIPYSQSLKLKELLKPGDTLITLQGIGHNGMTSMPAYLAAIQRVLSTPY
jgi:uncharacterized protein